MTVELVKVEVGVGVNEYVGGEANWVGALVYNDVGLVGGALPAGIETGAEVVVVVVVVVFVAGVVVDVAVVDVAVVVVVVAVVVVALACFASWPLLHRGDYVF